MPNGAQPFGMPGSLKPSDSGLNEASNASTFALWKSAKPGDSVVVKTNENVTTGGAEIPKGSKLVGQVTNVQPRGDGKDNSQIAIQFDKAELKGGQTVAIESVIQSVSPAAGSGTDISAPSPVGAIPASPNMPSASGSEPAAR